MPVALLVSLFMAVAFPLGSGPPPVDRDTSIIRAGDHVRIVVDAGPVRVERQAVAVQSARNGQRFFVKTAQGEVFAVRAEVAR